MSSNPSLDSNVKLRILNQLFAAQTMLHIFPNEIKLGEFIINAFNGIPGIKQSFFCSRNGACNSDERWPYFHRISDFVKDIPEEQDHFSLPMHKGDNIVHYPLKTIKRTFGSVYVVLEDPGIFESFTTSISNFVNVVALELENRWQKAQLNQYQFQLEDLVDKRTGELKKEIIKHQATEKELYESEKRFKALYNNSPDMHISVSAKDASILQCNETFLRNTGYSREEVIGFPIFKMYHESCLDEVKLLFKQFVETGVISEKELQLRRKDGSQIEVSLSVNSVKDENGRVQYSISSWRDITDRRVVEKELVRAKEKAEESDRLKSAFLANMSHEIRTPMNGILGFAGLLRKPELKAEKQKEFVDIIEKSGIRMLNIINEIIDISKIESGTMNVSIKETDINLQLDYILTLFDPEIEKKKLSLALTKSLAARDAIVHTDGEKLCAILTNLVKNAIKYTDEGFIEFGCIAKGDFLEFFVKDSGIGIPEDSLSSIFDRFIQADITDVQARQGAGLGLSISKAFVEMLGGKIWLISEVGKGSCFYFTILRDISPEQGKVEKDNDTEIVDSDSLDLKILIVEDDDICLELMSVFVEGIGKQILTVRDGAEAVKTCRSHTDIDLVLMDIDLPKLNGIEATKQIRQFNKEVIIIAQTALGLTGDREKILEAGCNDYILKPIEEAALIRLVRKYF